MWRVIIQCSAESWSNHATAFNAILAKYPATSIGSKKMRDDGRRIMEFQLENVSDVEDLIDECSRLEGFSGEFESL